jgi:predicted ATPase
VSRRIVVTGGPGSGKTVITAAIAQIHPERFVLVSEAATQVYTQLQTRWDKLDREGRHDVQRRIYHLQREQEERVAREHPAKTLLLDRGTIDGAAYWPEGAVDYWRDLGTTHAAELARYDGVILLETCAVLGLYDGDSSNFCRFEDPQAAIASSDLLKRLWRDHPRVRQVGAFIALSEKLDATRTALEKLVSP